MKSVLQGKDIEGFTQTWEYPENFSDGGMYEQEYEGNHNGTSYALTEIRMEGICLKHYRVSLKHEVKIKVAHDFPFLKMHFEIVGGMHYSPENEHKFLELPDGTHQLFFMPRFQGDIIYNSHSHRHALEIKLTPEFLKDSFQNDMSVLKHIEHAMIQQRIGILHEPALPITPELYSIISEILHCPHIGSLKALFLKAKIAELLVMQIGQSQAFSSLPESSRLTKGDIEKLQLAERLIHERLDNPYTLPELSRQSGLNTLKLKKGFRELFDTTPFGYLTKIRMEKGREMILSGKHSIADIAYAVGYKNAQHFTVAFKKMYGIKPSEVRHQR